MMAEVVDLTAYRRQRWANLLRVDGPCVASTSDGTRWQVISLTHVASALSARLDASGKRVGGLQCLPLTMLRKTKETP
jgi:hypothetical protein